MQSENDLPEELSLSADKKFLLFQNAPTTIGITTNFFGDNSYANETSEQEHSQLLADTFEAEIYHKLRVLHGSAIFLFEESIDSRNYYPADGLITFKPNRQKQLLISNTADCPIIVLTNRARSFHAIIHSGWKGTALNIVSRMVSIIQCHDIELKNVLAYIWPGIKAQLYPVGPEVTRCFHDKYTKNGHLSLRDVIHSQLRQAGLVRRNIIMPDICSTYHNHDSNVNMYSHRFFQDKQRNAVFIVV